MTTSKSYDYLNRLTQISSQPGASGLPPMAFNYSYNPANQRTQDKLADGSYWVYQYDSLGQVISGHKYFYDNTPVPGQQFDYTFDTTRPRYDGTSTTNCFVAYDGNGNVAELVNAADGTSVANYEYGPFGEVIRATGPMAKVNPFRFSTKYDDDESDQLYYGYRYYKPSTGGWLNRDPIGEFGGNNLYEFAFDNPVSKVDSYGLDCANDCENQYQRDQQKIKHDYEVCLAWYYGILTGNQCLARPRPPLTPPAILGGLSGCGAKAAAAQTAATARLAGCLSGCPSSSCFIAPAPPLPPHDPGQCPNTGNAPWGI